MRRLRALGFAVVTALAVFTYLALPLLRDLYGPVVNFPVYGGIALLAGVFAYGVVRWVQDYADRAEERATGRNEVLVEGEVYKVGPDGDGEDGDGEDGGSDEPQVDVEVEMEQLKDDSGKN